jgi:hypothetical protein
MEDLSGSVVEEVAAAAETAEPSEAELREFGRGWVTYLDLDPDEQITHIRPGGARLEFPLGDVAIVSPHSVGAFNKLAALIAEHGDDHPAVAEQIDTIMGYVKYYRGEAPAAG